ncbi:MAG: hypothetical protein DRP97_07005 [Candidatus Latescibacterota bacterium]|nr:MAG: hypothetical protein DRP97_07005 [Candidatus Latescibacterota bacterium]
MAFRAACPPRCAAARSRGVLIKDADGNRYEIPDVGKRNANGSLCSPPSFGQSLSARRGIFGFFGVSEISDLLFLLFFRKLCAIW